MIISTWLTKKITISQIASFSDKTVLTLIPANVQGRKLQMFQLVEIFSERLMISNLESSELS